MPRTDYGAFFKKPGGDVGTGRPCKLTPELQESICKTLQFGVDVETACKREGISEGTYYGWRKRGQAGEEPFAGFLAATDRAMADLESKITVQVLKAATNNWQAAAWWLRFRKTGGKQQVELTGANGQPIGGVLTPEGAEVIRKQILFGERADAEAEKAERDAGGFGTDDPAPEQKP